MCLRWHECVGKGESERGVEKGEGRWEGIGNCEREELEVEEKGI